MPKVWGTETIVRFHPMRVVDRRGADTGMDTVLRLRGVLGWLGLVAHSMAPRSGVVDILELERLRGSCG